MAPGWLSNEESPRCRRIWTGCADCAIPASVAPGTTHARPLALAAAFILAALLGLFFFDVLFLGKTLKVSRTIATVYPTGPADAPGPPPLTIQFQSASPGRLGLFFAVVLAIALGKIYAIPGLNLVGALPLLRFVRFSPHLPATVGFAAAVLVGFALDAVGRGTAHPRRATTFAVSLGAVALGFVAYNLPVLDWGRTIRARCRSGSFSARCQPSSGSSTGGGSGRDTPSCSSVAILVGELRLYQPTAHPDRYAAFAEAPYVRWLRATPDRGRVFGTEWTLFPNTASAFALDDLGIYGGLFVDRFVRFVRALIDPGRFAVGSHVGELRARLPDYASPFLDLLSVRYLVAPAGAPEPPGDDARLRRRRAHLPAGPGAAARLYRHPLDGRSR